jgi:O-antigen/teichoic acid export membrane protein
VAAARLHPAPTIGAATALFSSLQFINYATNLGIQDVLSRFHLGRRGRTDSLLTWSVGLSFATSVAGAVGFLVIAPAAVTRAFEGTGWGWGAATMTALCAGTALVAAVDARLMAARRWRLVFWRLVIIGAARLPLLALPTPRAAALWIFAVMAGPIAVSGYLGLAVVLRVTGARPSIHPRPSPSQLRFAGAAWLTNILVLSPQFALPVVVFANVDAATYAAFFLAWAIVAVVTVLPVVTSRVLLTEGSRTDADADHHTRRALSIAVGASALATLSAVLLHPLVTMLYGSSYARVADLLPSLCLGAVPWAVTAVLLGRGRLRHDSRTMLITTSVMAVGVVGGALLLTPAHGVSGAVAAWIGGNAVSAGTALLLERRASVPSSPPPVPDTRSVAGTAV